MTIEDLPSFLKRRSERAFSYLCSELESISPESALVHRRPDWPGQPWGVGQDGSIAGIARHVGAWKLSALPLLTPEGEAGSLAETDLKSIPDPASWPDVLTWLRATGAECSARIRGLSNEDMEATRRWEGEEMSVLKIVITLYEHDIQHAAQVEYLSQRLLAEAERA